jgi:hypothetical protein
MKCVIPLRIRFVKIESKTSSSCPGLRLDANSMDSALEALGTLNPNRANLLTMVGNPVV